MVWLIALATILLILIRPFRLAEAWWATAGALLLLLGGFITPRNAWAAVAKGTDVYLFLAGMMLMSELARHEGLFDWLASLAMRAAKGSQTRLFALVFVVGIVVTALLSNDATAVVLTPAVLAAVRAAEAEPLPYLLICAFIANAASFVLPISNPANLVVYAGNMPPLAEWVSTFALPSLLAIAATFAALRWISAGYLKRSLLRAPQMKKLSAGGRFTLCGIGLLTGALLAASAFHRDLGWPAVACGLLVTTLVAVRDHKTALAAFKGVSWSVLPLVAGLFVVVEAVNGNGGLTPLTDALQHIKGWPVAQGSLAAGFGIALLSNVINNLPSGLLAATALKAAAVSGALRDAVLVGVDLGPNLSVGGSLATILWLIAIRRDGLEMSYWKFLRCGAIVMPPALILALLALLVKPLGVL